MAEMDPLLKILLFGDDDSDGLNAPDSLYNDLNRQDDSVPHPVDALFERAKMAAELGKGADPGWNEEVSTVEKRKSGTLAQRLGITRTEFHEEDGVRYVHAFNAANELWWISAQFAVEREQTEVSREATAMKVSEHLAANHEAAQERITSRWPRMPRAKAEIFRALHKESGLTDDAESNHSKMADACDVIDLHDQFAAHHADQKEACMKAQQDLLNKLVPDQIRESPAPSGPDGSDPRRPATDGRWRTAAQRAAEFAKLVEIDDD